MASDFLTSLAKSKAQKIDQQFGPNAYGGTKFLTSSTPAGAQAPASPSRDWSFFEQERGSSPARSEAGTASPKLGSIRFPSANKTASGNVRTSTLDRYAEKAAYDDNIQSLKSRLATLQEEKSRLEAGLALDMVAPVQNEIEQIQRILRYAGKEYDDNFFGQFGASYAQGRISQDEAYGWNAYLGNPTPDAKQYAENISSALREFQIRNKDALDEDAVLPGISQDLAGYLPQFVDQTKARVAGGAAGAAAGALIPVVGIPNGIRAGAIAGSSIDMYNLTRGYAFKALVDEGVDVDTARSLAGDEAFLSSILEAGDTMMDMATLGVNGIIKNAAKGSLKGFAKKGAEAAASVAGNKLKQILEKHGVRLIGGYLANVAGEAAQEGAQQVVSIANRDRGVSGDGSGIPDLFFRSIGTGADILTGKNPDGLDEVADAAAQGAKIAAMMGGATILGTQAVSRALGTIASSPEAVEDTVKTPDPEPAASANLEQTQADAREAAILRILEENGVTGTPANRQAQGVAALIDGGELSSNRADEIRKSRAAQAAYTQITGETIDTTGRPAEVRARIKQMALDKAAERNAQNVVETIPTQAAVETATQEATEAPVTPVTTMGTVYTNQAETSPVIQYTPSPASDLDTISQRVYNINLVDRMAQDSQVLGEAGRAAAMTRYDGTTDPSGYYAGFMQAYNDGMNGKRNRQNSVLTKEQYNQAYNAGRTDARAGLTREGAGLVRNASAVKLRDAGTIDSLAKKLGVTVVAEDTIFSPDGRKSGANGYIKGREIHIALDAEDPAMVVFKHEVTHYLQEQNAKGYQAFRDYAVQAMGEDEVRKVQDLYRRGGVELTWDGAMDEVAANYTENLLTDEEAVRRLIRDDRNLAQKILDAIKGLLQKVKGQEGTKLRQAEKLWTEMFREIAGQEQADRGTMEVRYSEKDGVKNGRAREETRGAFLQRATSEGLEIYEGKTAAYGFRRAGQPDDGRAGEQTSRGAETQQELTVLGISADVVDGPIWRNQNGITSVRYVQQSVTVGRSRIFISKDASLPPRNIAGHEAFHLWKSGVGRDSYIETVEDNLDFSSDAFLEYQSPIADAYLGGEVDLANDAQMDVFREELFAYISGDIHEGVNDDMLRPMFRDYDAVKTAWETLVRENAGQKQTDRGTMEEAEIYGGDKHQGHDTQKRGMAVRDLQEAHPAHTDLRDVPRTDTRGDHVRGQNLQESGTEGTSEQEVTRFSLNQENQRLDDVAARLDQIRQEGEKAGKSEAEILTEIRGEVDSTLERLRTQYGTIPEGERPTREANAPKQTTEQERVSQTVRTVLEAGVTPDAMVPTIQEAIARGDFSYESFTDKMAIDRAAEKITDESYQDTKETWLADVASGKVSKESTALGWALYNNAANSGHVEDAMKILTAMIEHQRSAAQAVQATRILKRSSPTAQLYGVKRSVENLQKELKERYGDKAPDLEINRDLAEQFLQAKTPEAQTEALRQLYMDIGRQMPSRFIDKWNAWRYLAMLGNPRTHIRNVLGNAFFAPVVGVKNLTATAIEAAVDRAVYKGTMNRSKGATGAFVIAIPWKDGAKPVFIGHSKADKALVKAAWEDFSNVYDEIQGVGKYNDAAQANRYIQDGKVVFRSKLLHFLEVLRKKNGELLELEDMWFSQPHYAAALAGYMKANGLTVQQLKNGRGIAEARAYAVLEAQKATYRDMNKFSETVSAWGRYNGNNEVRKALSMGTEGILPFRQTPANILVRGVEYSPIGLLKSLTVDLNQVRKGKMEAYEAIDHISAGLTGTGLMGLGILLASLSLVRGAGGDDKEKREFEELMGHQAYALELPDGTSVTLDWLAPEALPFFVGVNLWEQSAAQNEKVTMSTLLQAVSGITKPMLEMSVLQSLNDLINSVGYASSNGLDGVMSILASSATSYLTQGIPTLFGQIERTAQDKRMTTYTEQDAFLTGDMQYTLGTSSGRIPGWDYQQIPYIDAWGQTKDTGSVGQRGVNNFLNPAYTSTIQESGMERELLRLYEATGDGSLLPSRAPKKFTVNNEQKDLTAEEYVAYATTRGETAHDLLWELAQERAYQSLDDESKAELVKNVYSYADAVGRTTVSDYTPTGLNADLLKLDEGGFDVADYLLLKAAGEAAGLSQLEIAVSSTDQALSSQLILNNYEAQRTAEAFTDPSRSGYEYQMNAGQQAQFTSLYEEAMEQALDKLFAGSRYQAADTEERRDMVSDLQAETNTKVKKEMARTLRASGVRSVKKG